MREFVVCVHCDSKLAFLFAVLVSDMLCVTGVCVPVSFSAFYVQLVLQFLCHSMFGILFLLQFFLHLFTSVLVSCLTFCISFSTSVPCVLCQLAKPLQFGLFFCSRLVCALVPCFLTLATSVLMPPP